MTRRSILLNTFYWWNTSWLDKTNEAKCIRLAFNIFEFISIEIVCKCTNKYVFKVRSGVMCLKCIPFPKWIIISYLYERTTHLIDHKKNDQNEFIEPKNVYLPPKMNWHVRHTLCVSERDREGAFYSLTITSVHNIRYNL